MGALAEQLEFCENWHKTAPSSRGKQKALAEIYKIGVNYKKRLVVLGYSRLSA